MHVERTEFCLPGRLAGFRPNLATDSQDAEVEATQLALRYQLLSPRTCWLVVARRDEGEKPGELPALRQVPHMLAAGWGGVGSVRSMLVSVECEAMAAPAPPCREESDFSWLRRAPADEASEPETLPRPYPETFIQRMCQTLARGERVDSLAGLEERRLEKEVLKRLRELVDAAHPEDAVVMAFVFLLARRFPAGWVAKKRLRELRRNFRQVERQGDWEGVIRSIQDAVDVLPIQKAG